MRVCSSWSSNDGGCDISLSILTPSMYQASYGTGRLGDSSKVKIDTVERKIFTRSIHSSKSHTYVYSLNLGIIRWLYLFFCPSPS